MAGLFFIRNMVLERSWYAGHPAYENADGRLVRAYLELLGAAVRSIPPGVVPADAAKLAILGQLPERVVAEHWEVLTAGWELIDDGYLVHRGVEEFVTHLISQHGSAISEAEKAVRKVESVLVAAATEARPANRPAFGSKRQPRKPGAKESSIARA